MKKLPRIFPNNMAFQVAGLLRRVAVRPGLRLPSHASISSAVPLVPRDAAGSALVASLSAQAQALGHARGLATFPGLAARGLAGLAPCPTQIRPLAAAIGAVQTRGMGYKASRRKSKSNGASRPLARFLLFPLVARCTPPRPPPA